ncbi:MULTISPECIES: MerR family transcriptional regulator [unclassified Azospirillum]|jgi:DNA-binding transcriptional MerR regulator|uniref:MerR family transcriptional regulator n=1 Tax=unclassified Azospirillum TaxID=2630922 RepID=UPI000B631500|nr:MULTISPECIES: MerR family transcriptional regulator [unclassified Azospirillum]SNS18915.1 MerR HTH family regulatory protein [Azospirillum sp. RU38E]SNS36589.1 MerR HTH family regulatory protein [Azospirillum sp. RU37A]
MRDAATTDTDAEEARTKPVAKSATAFRTISEVSADLEVPQHVLRFWETKFPQIKPLKRGGGRRYYRPDDVELLRRIQALLYREGYTIRGVQRLLKETRGSGGLPPVGQAPAASLFNLDEGEVAGGADQTADDSPALPELGEGEAVESDPLSPRIRERLSDILIDMLAARRLLD